VLVRAGGIVDGSQADGSQWLDVSVRGRQLHAPLIERLLELPMDIHSGRVGRCAVLHTAGAPRGPRCSGWLRPFEPAGGRFGRR
jgi:hypothetical protein